jgi:Na+/H+-dicarboxylate symporter/ABC-type amino acid transport substrate-binding protein
MTSAQPEADKPAREAPSSKRARWRPSLASSILLGLFAGIACGLFGGEYCAGMSVIGDAFIGLMRMTVMPYIMVSLVTNLGRLSLTQSRRLAAFGGLVLLALWAVTLLTVFVLSHTFPTWKSGSFFSTAITEEAREFDFVSVFIPSNIFESLSENHVPAVVLFCICLGLALAKLPTRQGLIARLDDLAKVLMYINHVVIRLAPIGVFAIAASTAGTMSMDEFGRLQAYFAAYTAGAFFLGFVVLPVLVSTCTPFRYREVISVSKDAMVTAFATGKLILALPILIEQTEKLFREKEHDASNGTAPAVDVLYPVAYPFPHVGKLLSMLFVPFAAWFLGNALAWQEYPAFLGAGLVSYFGGPLLAIPHLLDLMHLPHDMFQLYLLSGVYGERIGDALGVMHLVAFTLLTTCGFAGRLQLQVWPLLRYLTAVSLLGFALVFGLRTVLARTLQFVQGKEEILAQMQLDESPVASVVIPEAFPNPDPIRLGETLLDRIRRRGVIRVGYNEDKLPFAWFNVHGDLVGFDIAMAHALAKDLGVTIEFVRFDRATLAAQLAQDDFDVVMSGLVGTLERAQAMQHTSPYMDVTLGLVVPDYRVRDFRTLDALRSRGSLKIGFVDLSEGFADRLREALPKAGLIDLSTNQQYFDEDWKRLDALLISAESGSAFTLLYPEFEVVIPDGLQVQLPLFYAIGYRDAEMRDFLEHWVALRRKDGTMQEYYDRWILGKTADARKPRWSVIRDVLHWVD